MSKKSVEQLLINRVSANKKLVKRGIGLSLASDEGLITNIDSFTHSGSFDIDSIMGGGYPSGRLVEISGEESSGKTTLVLLAIANAQKEGDIVVLIEPESSLDTVYARKIGVDLNKLLVSNPDTVEEVFHIIFDIIKLVKETESDRRVVIVWDSVASTSTEGEMEGKELPAKHARYISQELRKVVRLISREKVVLIFTNQVKDRINVMFGDKSTTFGGRAIKFHATIRLRLRVIGKIKVGKDAHSEIRGVMVAVKTIKNKIFPPFKEAIVNIIFGGGIDKVEDIFNVALKTGILKKKRKNSNIYVVPSTLDLKSKSIDSFKRSGFEKYLINNKWLIKEVRKAVQGYVNNQ